MEVRPLWVEQRADIEDEDERQGDGAVSDAVQRLRAVLHDCEERSQLVSCREVTRHETARGSLCRRTARPDRSLLLDLVPRNIT